MPGVKLRVISGGLVLASVAALAWLALAPDEPRTLPGDAAPTSGLSGTSAADGRAGGPHDGPTLAAMPRGVASSGSTSSEGHRAVGDKLAGLYREWTEERHRELFEDHVRPELLQEQLEWYRNALGECSATAEVMLVRHPRQARHALSCERGVLEIEPVRDEAGGKAHGLRIGARGVDPPEIVEEVAERFVALLNEWDQDLYDALFAQGFKDDKPPEELGAWLAGIAAESGECTLGPVELANPRGAIYLVECAHTNLVVKLDLDDDDRVRTLLVKPKRPAP